MRGNMGGIARICTQLVMVKVLVVCLSASGSAYEDLSSDYLGRASHHVVEPPVSPRPVFDLPQVSPYWADPNNNPPNPLPVLTQANLAPPKPSCQSGTAPCNASALYRPLSGRCNNLVHPDHGTSGQFLRPILPPVFDGGVMRVVSAGGGLLPNPRVLSLLLRHVPQAPRVPTNLFLMQIGQFIDHDLAVTSIVKYESGESKNCLPCESWINPSCAPIPIPDNDPIMSPRINSTHRRCLPFIRSVAELMNFQHQTTLSHPNLNTAFLDLSPIYGNDDCAIQALRSFSDGLLRTSGNDLLVKMPRDSFPACRAPSGYCYFSGDLRVNENLGLTAMHLLFHREHNRLARALKVLNPHWDGERLFQETRRINIAQHQHYIYNEYLPTLLGRQYAEERGLLPQKIGHFMVGYDATADPGILKGFTTAAFRMGHSQILGDLLLLDSQYKQYDNISLVSTFHNTEVMDSGIFDSLLRGLLKKPHHSTDLVFVEEVLDHLFKAEGKPHSGQDLFALNIARGRDLGLAPYTGYLKDCGVLYPTTFADLKVIMPAWTVAALGQAYTHVDDIDLYVGGLAESPLPGGVVGPTFACIIARQFRATRVSDRFWYEGLSVGFTKEQLESLRGTSLAKLVCNGMDEPDPAVPTLALLTTDNQSPVQPCSSLPALDLSLWRDRNVPAITHCSFQRVFYPDGAYIPISPCLYCICRLGRIHCRCDTSGCSLHTSDYYCRRVCGLA